MSGVKHPYPKTSPTTVTMSAVKRLRLVLPVTVDFLFTWRYWRYALVQMDWFNSLLAKLQGCLAISNPVFNSLESLS